MARNRWSFRNYNAFLRVMKRKEGLTHKEAQQSYRNARDALGRSAYAIDVKRSKAFRGKVARSAEAGPSFPEEPSEAQDFREAFPAIGDFGDATGEELIELYEEFWSELQDFDFEEIDFEGEEGYKDTPS